MNINIPINILIYSIVVIVLAYFAIRDFMEENHSLWAPKLNLVGLFLIGVIVAFTLIWGGFFWW